MNKHKGTLAESETTFSQRRQRRALLLHASDAPNMTETIRGRPAVPFIANDRQLHLTMLYDDDAEVIARILGNDDVNRELTLVPTPYTLEDAHSWLRFKANEQANFHQLDWSDEAAVSAALQDAIPFHAIRDNSGQMIGDIGIRRSMFELVQDGAEKGKFIKENASKAAGDATIEYTLGKSSCFLIP